MKFGIAVFALIGLALVACCLFWGAPWKTMAPAIVQMFGSAAALIWWAWLTRKRR